MQRETGGLVRSACQMRSRRGTPLEGPGESSSGPRWWPSHWPRQRPSTCPEVHPHPASLPNTMPWVRNPVQSPQCSFSETSHPARPATNVSSPHVLTALTCETSHGCRYTSVHSRLVSVSRLPRGSAHHVSAARVAASSAGLERQGYQSCSKPTLALQRWRHRHAASESNCIHVISVCCDVPRRIDGCGVQSQAEPAGDALGEDGGHGIFGGTAAGALVPALRPGESAEQHARGGLWGVPAASWEDAGRRRS
jgi:hypothetical protein